MDGDSAKIGADVEYAMALTRNKDDV